MKTEKEAFNEFATAWGIKDADRVITFDDFFEYYAVIYLLNIKNKNLKDLSSGYEKDEEFQLMLSSVWNLP